MKATATLFALISFLFTGCSTTGQKTDPSFYPEIINLAAIEGKTQYLASPFVTAGDRIYIIGHQDGSFPDLGWHIDGEMGGVWDHPIKLLDGFAAQLTTGNRNRSFCLDKAEQFINYPMANHHHFTWPQENLEIDRIQFIPDGVEGAIVEFRIVNKGTNDKAVRFSFTGMTDLRPTWLGERTNMVDAEDEILFDEKSSAVIAKDKDNPWFVMFGSTLKASFTATKNECTSPQRKGLGKNATLSYSLTVQANSEVTIPVFIAGSYLTEKALRANYETIKTRGREKLTQKIDRYKNITNTAQLTIPDKNIEQMYEWLKYNTDWLVRNVPELGIGLCAGLPDYPWWFGADAAYSLQGVLATGDHELAKNTILLLHKISRETNNNGRIIHEVSTNGSVYNKGNVNETAQFMTLVNTYYEWTGDKELVTRLFPDLKKGMKWLLEERDPDGNRYPNGSGMMEIPGLESELEMIDVAAYTQQALASAAALARALDEQSMATEYQALADELKARINKEWWKPNENSFGDFRGTTAEAMPVLKAALLRSDTLGKSWAVAELKETQKQMKKYSINKSIPHVIYHNWAVNTPLETGVADADKAQAALKKAKTYENPFGVFVTGIDRTNEPDSVVLKSRKKTFSYTGAVMTLPTGVQAVAASKYGSAEEALEYISKLNQSFSYALPGSMYEVSPDFGMITQAWNIYGVAVPIVNHFFGIKPRAYEKSISISPNLPKHWKDVSIRNVKVGDNALSLAIIQKDDHKEYRIQQTLDDWSMLINVKNAKKLLVNGQETDLKTLSDNTLKLNGGEIVLLIY
ncbi:MAG TPA: glycogen debranching protein [Cyclobacteriaceae bacterium]